MPPTVSHIFLTRFNMATPGRELAIRTQPGWLQHRFELFEQFCLPSVAAQTRRDFEWIIYFDEETPDEFKARVEDLRAIFPFTPYYCGLFGPEGTPRSIQECFAPQTDLVLTTRLDNDDAIAKDFVERLREEVRLNGYARAFYNFRNGLTRRDGAVYHLSHDCNPFFSLLEDTEGDLTTAKNVLHMEIAEHGEVIQIEGAPAWMQVVHGKNVSNRIKGSRVMPSVAAQGFAGGAGEALEPFRAQDKIAERLLYEPARNVREFGVDLVRGRIRAR